MYGRSRKGEMAKEKNGMYNKKHTDITRKKMSASRQGHTPAKGMKHTEEHKAFMQARLSSLMWFNDGNVNVRKTECPLGFTAGRLKK
jgi:hypothetical protein